MESRLLRYWIGFNRAKGIGPIRQRMLTDYFGDIERAWNASADQLRKAGLDQRSLQSLLTTRVTCDLDAELQAVEKAGARAVTLEDVEYPAPLRNIPDPPALLYVKGSLLETDQKALAVVGTRRATTYGKTMTREIVEPLAQTGVVIVSGLANGIDTVAHQSAIDAGGRTLAAMATGIDQIYPPQNHRLAEAIQAHGALLTELPLGEPPESRHFAPRNRIVSGLSLGTLVVEAAERSGALLTANLALDQGRDVFAVPGNASSPTSKGTNTLIQQGAVMVTGAADILDALKLASPQFRSRSPRVSVEAVEAQGENEIEVAILHSLSTEPQNIDDLSQRIGFPVKQVSSALTILELKGFVQQVGSMQFALAGA